MFSVMISVCETSEEISTSLEDLQGSAHGKRLVLFDRDPASSLPPLEIAAREGIYNASLSATG